MSHSESTLHLFPDFFTPAERPLLQCGELSASLFRYPSGVAAVSVEQPSAVN